MLGTLSIYYESVIAEDTAVNQRDNILCSGSFPSREREDKDYIKIYMMSAEDGDKQGGRVRVEEKRLSPKMMAGKGLAERVTCVQDMHGSAWLKEPSVVIWRRAFQVKETENAKVLRWK